MINVIVHHCCLNRSTVLLVANRSLLLLVGNLGDGTTRLRESTVLSFVVRQMHMQHSFSNKYLGSLLALTHRVSWEGGGVFCVRC